MNKALLALPIGGVIALTGCSAPFTVFEDAISTCGNPQGVTLGDDGSTLTIDMMGETDYSGSSYNDVECIVDAVGTPTYIKDNMWATNALSGRQTDTFENITVSWSYHPDNGLDAVFHYSTK
jgi:hypothetical protein